MQVKIPLSEHSLTGPEIVEVCKLLNLGKAVVGCKDSVVEGREEVAGLNIVPSYEVDADVARMPDLIRKFEEAIKKASPRIVAAYKEAMKYQPPAE